MAFHTYLCTSRICLAYFCVNGGDKGVISFSLKEQLFRILVSVESEIWERKQMK